MKTKNEILNELYETDFVKKYTAKLLKQKDFLQDAEQEIWLIICNQPSERIENLYENGGINKVRQFVSGIISRQINSTTSNFYNTYIKKDFNDSISRKITEDRTTPFDEENGWDIDIKKECKSIKDDFETLKITLLHDSESTSYHLLNILNEYERNILLKYIELGSYTALAREMNVCFDLAKEEITRIREKIVKNAHIQE